MNRKDVVYVVDDDEAIRQGLCALFSTVSVAARAYASATEFLAVAQPDMPGCLVLDVRMPGMSGLELQQVLTERGIHLPVILISGHGDVPMAVRAMKAGALDFLLKPFNEQDLLDRVLAAINSNDLVSQRDESTKQAAARFDGLTQREREVLALIMECKHSKGIAYDLNISEKTVDVHRFNIMRKTGARNLSELVQLRLLAGEAL
jgi:FixJ family two-component response regulator